LQGSEDQNHALYFELGLEVQSLHIERCNESTLYKSLPHDDPFTGNFSLTMNAKIPKALLTLNTSKDVFLNA